MASSLRAGVLYFAMVFAAGFVFGMVRVLWMAPRVGEASAVLIELPVMLALSWIVCGWLVRRCGVSSRLLERAVMGGLAFLLLMAGELGVSVFGLGMSADQHFQVYQSADAQIGLAAQVVFALLPLIQMIPRPWKK